MNACFSHTQNEELHRCNRKEDAMAEKKVTVQVLKPYRDLQKMLLFHADEQHEVTEKRAEELIQKGFVKKIDTATPKGPKK